MKFNFLTFFCLIWVNLVSGQTSIQSKVSSQLYTQTKSNVEVDFIVVLNEKADLSFSNALKTKAAKSQYVFAKLRRVANQSQEAVVELLKKKKVAYNPFFIVNAIAAKGDLALIEALAELKEVAEIIPDPWVKMEEPIQSIDPIRLREGIEWGIQKINADKVWDLGFRGEGVIIGGQDTGYEWEHPALKGKYKGWDGASANHDYAWFDAINEISPLHRDSVVSAENNPCGLNTTEPCDDGSHGTHTMGTMIGDDELGNQIGVAPGAKWVGCRCMERGWGKPSTYINCFQWFLAPTRVNGDDPDPLAAPHVINNSWSCPEIEGCNDSNWALMEETIDNLVAAGIFVVVSAGNSGSRCNTVSAPPAIFENSFSIGATMQNDTIARFSSRGLVMVDGSGRLKPDVTAPGVGVRSAISGGNYASFNGTSMAGPHVAGAVALIISANPQLAGDVEMIKRILRQTAMPMGAGTDCDPNSSRSYPNNTYGYGRIDVALAVKEALGMISTSTSNHERNTTKVLTYPNPVSDQVTILLGQVEQKPINFTLFDQMGRIVFQKNWDSVWKNVNEQLLEVQFSNPLPSGLYSYQIQNGRYLWTGKLIRK